MSSLVLAALGGFGVGLALGAAAAAKVMSDAYIAVLKEGEAKGRVLFKR